MKLNPLDQVRSSLVMSVFVLSVFIFSSLAYGYLVGQGWHSMSRGEQFTWEGLLWCASYVLLAWLLWLVAGSQRGELIEIIFYVPEQAEIKSYLWLSVGMVISAIGFVYLLFYPLSLIWPEFVLSWLLDAPRLFYWDAEGVYVLGNVLSLISVVLLAPVIEEYLFRGYLLNRWTLQLGAWPAILLSSSLFAILHPDILGAFVFGVFMALLYFKTSSLLAPIIVHMGNNIIAVVFEWLDLMYLSEFEEAATLQDFYDYLGLGVICLFVGCFWLWRFAHTHLQPIQTVVRLHEQGKGGGRSKDSSV